MSVSLLLVGGGKMGGALLAGWIEDGRAPDDIAVIEPDPAALAAFRGAGGPAILDAPGRLDPDAAPKVVVFAVKPQAMDEITPLYRPFAGPGTVFLSIAAGKPLAHFERHLGPRAAVVRSMPNTPAAVGRGVSVACANAAVSAAQRRHCAELLSAVGEVYWVEDESLLDPVTAVSGSGPGYVFLFVECLARAGVEAGLGEDLAMRLARGTVAGSGELMRLAEESAAELRRNVTSPGGTTQAALEVLMAADGLQPLMTRAVRAASERSRELAG